MRYRTLGPGGPVVSAIGLTARSFLDDYGRPDGTVAHTVLSELSGVDLIDLTGAERAEPVIGEALRGRRDQFTLVASAPPGDPVRACAATLRRLRTDHLDVYHVAPHQLDAATPLIAAGMVGHLGLAGVDPDRLSALCDGYPVVTVAAEYSLIHREPERELLPAAAALGLGVLAGRPLGLGRLTDADHRWSALEEMAATLQLSVVRLVLAWVLARGERIVALPATQSVTHLEMNASAADLDLGATDIARLSALFPLDTPTGTGGASIA
jgi:aryl-alcohol dehydrogenase-like predicted oxidoreductase